ncbi:MAG: tripartite tricarboxylate transporter substrate binding protein [Desulfobacterales bacterium]|nr:tripartite tricarboxylate transporter substrate binding protein [Desulfobacterales bacterium]
MRNRPLLRIALSLLAVSVALGLATKGAMAADYPVRPINFILGYTPGSSPDVTIRALVEPAGKILGQPIVVLNKPGAATALAMAQIKNEKPDGYTIGSIVGSSILTPHLEQVPYDAIKDFTPIIKVVDNMMGLAVSADAPWKTMQDFIDYAKANPGKIKYSHFGTVNRMAVESFAREAGLKLVAVPQKGPKEGALALLGKHVDAFAGGVDWAPYLASGDFRLLATFGPKRYSLYPNVTTFVDLGYKSWMASPSGIVGPKGLPAPIVAKLHDAFKTAMQDPGFLKVVQNQTLEVAYKNPTDLAREIADLDELFAGLIKLGMGKE